MRAITRTVYSAEIQTAQYLNLPYTPQQNSTLNERFNILPDIDPDQKNYPQMQYLTLGIGGHQAVTSDDNVSYIQVMKHAATDASPFKPLPFVVRAMDNDLSDSQRANYALRRIETYGGTDYIVYYAKRLDLSQTGLSTKRITYNSDGTKSVSEFSPDSAHLYPDPIEPLSEAEVLTASGEYVGALALIEINFDENDVEEIMNAAQIVYGSSDYAAVSEFAFCTGKDYTTQGEIGTSGAQIEYDDVIACQVAVFASSYMQLSLQSKGFTITTDAGISEPLFVAH